MAQGEWGRKRAYKRPGSSSAMRTALDVIKWAFPGAEVPTINCPARGTIAYQRCSEFQASCRCRCPVGVTASKSNRVVLVALETIVVESYGADPIMCRVCGEVEVARAEASCKECRAVLLKGKRPQ